MPEVQPQSPLWWLRRLESKLGERKIKMARWNRYYTGDHPLPIVREKLRQDFLRLLEMSRSNFCEIVVDAVEERLNIEGFRVSATSDAEADQRAWEIWQANSLDAESQVAHTDALIMGVTNISVWKTENAAFPTIAVENPAETIVETMPGSRRERAAALKLWKDDWTGAMMADVWLPDAIWSFTKRTESSGEWKPHPSEDDHSNRNPLGVVTMVPLINKPRSAGWGRSELELAIPSQDRINKLLFDLMLSSELTSFRQRWATGLDIPVDEETNQPQEPFKAAIDRLWVSEDPATKFGDFEATPLKPYIDAIEQAVLHMAVQTRTPRHYLIEQGQSPSGDAIKSAETGLVAKARRKMRHFGESWEEVMRLARSFDGAETAVDSEVVWADPEYRSEGELIDAAVKKAQSLAVPLAQVWEDIGYTPTQIARFDAMRLTDSLMAVLGQSTVQVSDEEEPDVSS